MPNINLIKTSIRSSQGNLDETVQAIKSSNIRISSKEVPTLEEKITIPYFLFEEMVQENKKDILEVIKSSVFDVISNLNENDRAQTALIIGTSQVDLNTADTIVDTIYEKEPYPSTCIKRSIDSYAKDISNEFGLNDYTMTIATACTSSANAVLEASNLIDAGIFKYVVIVGLEIFSSMMSSGFSSMKLLSQSCQKPFDNSREGLVLGEAIASILLGKDNSTWSIKGGFSNCDSATITSVSEGGDEFAKVMRGALEISGISTQEITALKAH
ncbi:MAG: 3-oxoacyl-ACP synthase, partial [Sulfurimonas sp.]|nr:3-oxoacyl-ACP synthase [Sulfurimonas sp.]